MAVDLQNPNNNNHNNNKIPRITDADSAFDDDDMFSDLPEPIIHYIFSLLETIDVVRLSAVSKKWEVSVDFNALIALQYSHSLAKLT